MPCCLVDDDDEDGASQAVEIDPYELMDAVDIVSKLPKDFYDKTVRLFTLYLCLV